MKDQADKSWLASNKPTTTTDFICAVAMTAAAVFIPLAIWYTGAL